MRRILIAHDGSAGADQAVDLVASMAWSAETALRIVTVIPDTREIRRRWAGLILDATLDLEGRLRAETTERLQLIAKRVASAGGRVEPGVLVGRPPQAIVKEARTWKADLIVIGSRGLGPFVTTLLGSVSAEVVDGAPCPVLVARTPDVRGILLATDGSDCALRAERYLAMLPVARRVPVTVVTVGTVFHAWPIGIAPTMVSRVMEIQAEEEVRAREVHGEIAGASAGRLAAAGIDARSIVRVGDPVAEVLVAAEEAEADLIVLGSRGQTGLKRLLLGSVARGVLARTTASVLIVRAGLGANCDSPVSTER